MENDEKNEQNWPPASEPRAAMEIFTDAEKIDALGVQLVQAMVTLAKLNAEMTFRESALGVRLNNREWVRELECCGPRTRAKILKETHGPSCVCFLCMAELQHRRA
jgi:hypothetical protein